MPRPRHTNPTPAELAVLHVIWSHGPCTVRQAMGHLNDDPPRAYTSVMSLMNVMFEKGLLKRHEQGRAHVYDAADDQQRTLAAMLGDLVDQAFRGSSATLLTHLLDQTNPSDSELREIQKIIAAYKKQRGDL